MTVQTRIMLEDIGANFRAGVAYTHPPATWEALERQLGRRMGEWSLLCDHHYGVDERLRALILSDPRTPRRGDRKAA